MTGRYVIEVETKVVVVRGYRAGHILRDAGLKAIWAGGGWMLDRHRLPDVRAALEHVGGRYREVERGAA